MQLSAAAPDALNYSCLHVTLRNQSVLDISTKEIWGVKERGGTWALDVMPVEIKAFQLLIDYYSQQRDGSGGTRE